AVIGCGFFAQFHLEAWRRIDGVEIVAACDPNIERARAAAARAYQSWEDMRDVEALDFVDIATRPDTHLRLVEQAAAAGLSIICQKPMAPTLDEAQRMAEVARQAGVRLMIHENWRWQPWYRVVRERLAAGDIGQPVTYRFRIRRRDGHGHAPYSAQPYFREMPRLLIFETLVHPIDTARFLFGEIQSITAIARRLNPVVKGEDFAQLLTAHTSGLGGIIDGHRFLDIVSDSPPLGDAEVEGEFGVLSVTASGDVLRNQKIIWRNEVHHGYRGDSVHATQKHFIDCLRTRQAFETGASEYLKTYAAVEAAYQSAAAGHTVTLGAP
ncbi:MAG: Gfo/Idh/MocA family oxidoreductase, partial [Bryobacterales bacterium]|nr:Gfo/Idh/MocA family oxidoreductase [Bryobacterales bacterium]